MGSGRAAVCDLLGQPFCAQKLVVPKSGALVTLLALTKYRDLSRLSVTACWDFAGLRSKGHARYTTALCLAVSLTTAR